MGLLEEVERQVYAGDAGTTSDAGAKVYTRYEELSAALREWLVGQKDSATTKS
jgi:hypothetical protein